MKNIKGYKVFNSDWTCRNKQYTCPGKFEEDVELDVCSRGLHFCKKAIDCFNYYDFDSNNHNAEGIAKYICLFLRSHLAFDLDEMLEGYDLTMNDLAYEIQYALEEIGFYK